MPDFPLPVEIAMDETPDACESPLLDDGSDGLVMGQPMDTLAQLARYQDEGQSYERMRRDLALDPMKVSNAQIDRAAEYGRTGGQSNYRTRRAWGGISLPSKG